MAHCSLRNAVNELLHLAAHQIVDLARAESFYALEAPFDFPRVLLDQSPDVVSGLFLWERAAQALSKYCVLHLNLLEALCVVP